MPATIADIAAGTRPAQIETWSSATIKSRYPSARDGGAEAAEGFCDSPSDANIIVTARGTLFGVERRRFKAGVADLLWPTPETAIPIVQLADVELAVNGKTLPARIEVDLDAERTSYEVFG